MVLLPGLQRRLTLMLMPRLLLRLPPRLTLVLPLQRARRQYLRHC